MALPALLDSWSSLYSGSAALRSAINFAHLGGLVGGGGCAIAADRAVLGAFRQGHATRSHHLTSLRHTHRVVLFGLVLVLVSGLLLLGADLDSYVASSVFWLKMMLVVLLLGNGILLLRAERLAEDGDEHGWRALRNASIASLVLWFTTTLAGVVLPNAL
jgi:hypothetical protein